MRKNSATEQPHPALNHRCPFCGAEPNQPCRAHRGRGHELERPHSRRRAMANPQPRTTPRQALCCECGQLRTVGQNYYRSHDENRGGGLFRDPRGWFDTGTLKCSHCGECTRHALLAVEGQLDYAEKYQSFVLGGASPYDWDLDREQYRERYFAQFPRNPFVQHRHWKSDEREAREAGKTWFRAMCGEPLPMPEQVRENGQTVTDMKAPTQLTDPERTEHENFDVETGLWWTAGGECVNCLRVRHEWLLKQHRKQLLVQLLEVSNAVDTMSAEDVTALRDHLDRIMGVAR